MIVRPDQDANSWNQFVTNIQFAFRFNIYKSKYLLTGFRNKWQATATNLNIPIISKKEYEKQAEKGKTSEQWNQFGECLG
ncbi:hypothetical protein [Roseivirga seohaensis]|uniref:hypothetical protein n=1 Tax=Roseivirga seohaensis TaxID=1914963 RepID=UPI003BA88B89